MTDNYQAMQQLHELEGRLQEVKAQLEPGTKPNRFKHVLRKSPKFVLSNWGFCAFWITVTVAVFVYWWYDVSYFETQRNIAQAKTSAEPYWKLGDRLMLIGEREAAQNAYKAALEINEYNVEATRGLLQTRVFDPEPGQKYLSSDVVRAKLEQLKPLFSDKDPYIISYYEGDVYEDQEDYKRAKELYQKAIDQNPNFVYGYIALAYVSVLAGEEIDVAITQLNKALGLDENSGDALNHLGFCYMLKGDYSKAYEKLEKSRQINPLSLEVFINLGNVQRLSGKPEGLKEAIDSHERALRMLEEAGDDDDNDYTGDLARNYMPESDNDKTSQRYSESFSDLKEKTMLVYYELSFDYAMRHDWAKANQFFNRAFKLDEDQAYAKYFDNQIKSLERTIRAMHDQSGLAWFEKQRHRFGVDSQALAGTKAAWARIGDLSQRSN